MDYNIHIMDLELQRNYNQDVERKENKNKIYIEGLMENNT